MAAAPLLSKAEYLKRYLSGSEAGAEGGPETGRKRRKKRPKLVGAGGKGMRIVDDDVSWTTISTTKLEKEEEDDGDLPVVAEFVDERPEEVKQMEVFRSSTKWKLLEGQKEELLQDTLGSSHKKSLRVTPDPSPHRRARHDTPDPSPPRKARHDTPDPSPPRRARHDTPDPSPPRKARHDTPDPSPPRRARHDTPDPSPPRRVRHDTPDPSPPRKSHHHPSGVSSRRVHRATSDLSPSKRARLSPTDASPPKRTRDSSDTTQHRRTHQYSRDLAPNVPHSLSRTKSARAPERTSSKHGSDADLSPPRKKHAKSHFGDKQPSSKGRQDSDSDLSPPRNRPRPQSSDSDLSPPRRKRRASSSDSDLSPPRRSQPPGKKATHMYSGAKTGLVLKDIQQEQQELRKQDAEIVTLEAEFQHAETVFRDKSGRKRNLKLERLEQRRKAEDSKREEQYAQWGKGLAQCRQQQQNVEDAIKEMQKPFARYIDDEDLDRMLREQEREGDPMANFIKKNKAKENKNKKEKPRYSGPAPPPNRFNIWPGYRWDGVDRSNGFEQKRFARLASKKAVEELAYKWSVEDM
ncbi:BUD13 homolog [Suncus etruscus]|uniref:BUD13 homolog n=1 Tax=Suncus etruscus TaxID=109475 RepID=UPI00210FF479|nr:BUD13 homolog [Suncus etruscus]